MGRYAPDSTVLQLATYMTYNVMYRMPVILVGIKVGELVLKCYWRILNTCAPHATLLRTVMRASSHVRLVKRAIRQIKIPAKVSGYTV